MFASRDLSVSPIGLLSGGSVYSIEKSIGILGTPVENVFDIYEDSGENWSNKAVVFI